MSPEQIQQRPIDGRSDLFCLGLVLFECLTGRRAFGGRTSIETMSNILHLPSPAPSGLRPELTESPRRAVPAAAREGAGRPLPVRGRSRRGDPRAAARHVAHAHAAQRRRAHAQRHTRLGLAQHVDVGRDRPCDTGRGRPVDRGQTPVGAARLCLPPRASCSSVVAGAAWFWKNSGGLPPVPPESEVWYQRGTEAIREGAYLTARKALEQAVTIFPQHVLAYARLAEADAELDDTRAAREHLLRVSTLAPDESRLPAAERLRLQALRALVLRDLDTSIARYRQVVTLYPADAGRVGRSRARAGNRGTSDRRARVVHTRDRTRSPVGGRLPSPWARRGPAVAARRGAGRVCRSRTSVSGALRCRGRNRGAADRGAARSTRWAN